MSEEIRKMFADIAPRYDVVNTVLSFGVHRRWRKRAVRLSGAAAGASALDCATGTGDLALELKRAVGREGSVVGTDFCAEMMLTAPAKALAAGLDVRYETADAMNLHYPNDMYDVATISFGIRNVDNPVVALREMARVVRPGGRVVVLEFGQPRGLFGALYRFYGRVIIPAVGGLLSGRREAYSYLVATSGLFPAGEKFLALMRDADVFAETSATPLTFGVAYVYVGVVR